MTKIIRIKEVCDTVGLSRASVYRLMPNNFPKPVRIGIKAVGWDVEDIDAWIAERKADTVSTTSIH